MLVFFNGNVLVVVQVRGRILNFDSPTETRVKKSSQLLIQHRAHHELTWYVIADDRSVARLEFAPRVEIICSELSGRHLELTFFDKMVREAEADRQSSVLRTEVGVRLQNILPSDDGK